MKVGELKRLLERIPDECEVLQDGGPDHSYFKITWVKECAVGYLANENYYGEWYGNAHALKNEKPINACVISSS